MNETIWLLVAALALLTSVLIAQSFILHYALKEDDPEIFGDVPHLPEQ